MKARLSTDAFARKAALALAVVAILLVSTLPAVGAPGTPRNLHLSWVNDPYTTPVSYTHLTLPTIYSV